MPTNQYCLNMTLSLISHEKYSTIKVAPTSGITLILFWCLKIYINSQNITSHHNWYHTGGAIWYIGWKNGNKLKVNLLQKENMQKSIKVTPIDGTNPCAWFSVVGRFFSGYNFHASGGVGGGVDLNVRFCSKHCFWKDLQYVWNINSVSTL